MKKITLIAPSFFGYDQAVLLELQSLGYNVIHLDDRPSNTNFFKICIRFKLSFFIQKILNHHRKNVITEILKSEADVLFLLNPEVFNAEMLVELKKINPSMTAILYLWDSFKNRKNAQSLIGLVDVAYSFDRKDCLSESRLKFYPLFFEKKFLSIQERKRDIDLAFIGSYHSNRANLLSLKEIDLNVFLHLYVQGPFIKFFRALKLVTNPRLLYSFWRNTTFETLSKKEVSEILKRSRCVIDLQHPNQSGLTCRTFEALASGCKVLTTNLDIINYEFYRPDVISVVNDLSSISYEFIKSDLSEDVRNQFSEKIKEYSISNWVESIVISNL